MNQKQLLFARPVPQGWRFVKVDQLKADEPSSCSAGPFGSNISSKYFVDSGIPVIRGSNLRADLTRFVPEGFVFVSPERATAYKGQHVRAGDLVFTCWGTLGQVGLIPENGPFDEYIISNKQLKLRPNRAIADPLFLFYYFACPEMVRHINSIAIGAAVPGINLGILKNLDVTLPPLPLQRKIAAILSAYDDLIANNTRRIAVLEEMAQSLYREWFVRFRFPGHEQARFIETEQGRMPEGWFKRLSEVAEINPESVKKGCEPDSIHYVDIASVSTGKIDEVTEMTFSSAPGRARRIVRDGDLIWSTVRPNRKSYALILKPPANMVVSTGFAVIRPFIAPFSFLYSALTTENFVTYLVNHAKGSAYPAVNSDDFENAPILVPSQPLLAEFHERTQPLFLLKHNLDTKNQNLRRTRDLLLPKLISGELDVEHLDIDTGEPQEAIEHL